MRLRHTVGAALGALALAVTIPTSAAHADAAGIFKYQWGLPGQTNYGEIVSPKTEVCHQIPQVEDKPLLNAFSPINSTVQTVWLFTEDGCDGPYTKMVAGSQDGPLRLFKSVYWP
ncbi:hypothetical protein [Streptomyces flavofungini]|uniref:hypothetical protein n=1 Tax=Streptomyces flavofungini TaxID=68200 RepID=UPI0025B09196|nr:hypothetical protein [Streptomyces flavofungini]WJV50930.1 hypothetical protein QUY26_38785 [Streptomyces flavofungini]